MRPIPVNRVVNDIMAKYDHNGNGVIDLKRPAGFWQKVFTPDERERVNAVYSSKTNKEGRKETVVDRYYYTQRDLFYAADKNRDGKVTPSELTAAVSKFDENKDGALSSRGIFGWFQGKAKQELEKFNDAHGEKWTNHTTTSF